MSPVKKMTSLCSTLNHSTREVGSDDNRIKIGTLCQSRDTVIPVFSLWQWPAVGGGSRQQILFSKNTLLASSSLWLSDFQKQTAVLVNRTLGRFSIRHKSCPALFSFSSICHLLVPFRFPSVGGLVLCWKRQQTADRHPAPLGHLWFLGFINILLDCLPAGWKALPLLGG